MPDDIISAVILASSASTATRTSADQVNDAGAGVLLTLDVTTTPNNSETATVSIQAKDIASGKYVTLTAFTALTASNLGASPTTATYAYTLRPGAAETSAVGNHEVQALGLPRNWRAVVTHSSSSSWTYTLTASGLH